MLSSYTIVDHNGIVLTRGLDSDQSVGKPDNAELFRQMRKGGEKGFLRVVPGLEGDKRIFFFQSFVIGGEAAPYLYVRVELPTSAVLAEPLAHLTWKVVFVFLVMAGALGGAWYIAKRSIVDRVARVTAAVNRLADGELNHGSIRAVAGGELGELSAAFDDMARKLAAREVALQEQAAFQEALLQSVPLPIFFTDVRGRYLGSNEAFTAFLGKDRNDVVGKTAYDLFPAETSGLFGAKDRELLKNPGIQTFELRLDHHTGVRQGMVRLLHELLEPSLEFDEASDGQEAVNLASAKEYSLMLLDISLPGRNGLDILKQIRLLNPTLPVLVVSMHSEEQYAIRALRAGAAGYVTKSSAAEVLKSAVEKVLQGGRYINPLQAELLADAVREDHGDIPLHNLLSDREYQLACMMTSGKTMTEIANELSLSIKTVSTYRTRVLEKLQLRTNANIINYCLTHNLCL